MNMICVDCGKETTIFREGSCMDCYLKRHQFTKGPSIFDIPCCTHCHAFKYKSNWKNESFEDILKRYIKQFFTISNELKNRTISVTCDDFLEKGECTVKIQGFIDEEPVSESHTISVKLKNNVCEICSKQFGGYHEAIIQIRPGNKKLSNKKLADIETFVDDTIISMQEHGNRKLFLADYGMEHSGLDFFISDKQAGYSIIKKVQDHFGGTITVSSKNVGMKDGKQLYRHTYLLRLIPFDIEDVIKLDTSYYFVASIKATTMTCIDLKQGTEHLFDTTSIEHARLIGTSEELSIECITVNQSDKEIQVMHPKTYQVFTLLKAFGAIKYDEKITLIQIDDAFYIKPEIKKKK